MEDWVDPYQQEQQLKEAYEQALQWMESSTFIVKDGRFSMMYGLPYANTIRAYVVSLHEKLLSRESALLEKYEIAELNQSLPAKNKTLGFLKVVDDILFPSASTSFKSLWQSLLFTLAELAEEFDLTYFPQPMLGSDTAAQMWKSTWNSVGLLSELALREAEKCPYDVAAADDYYPLIFWRRWRAWAAIVNDKEVGAPYV